MKKFISYPPFKGGHARFPMVPFIPLSDCIIKNTSVSLYCKCKPGMSLQGHIEITSLAPLRRALELKVHIDSV